MKQEDKDQEKNIREGEDQVTPEKIPPDVTIMTEDTVIHLGVPITLSGYSYLVDAIELAIEDRNRVNAVNKTIYSEVADKYNVSPATVEKCIRKAIGSAWERKQGVIEDYFNDTGTQEPDKRPTNREFISTVSWNIKRQMMVDGNGNERS